MLPRSPPARSLLWRSLRIHQVYGANTEVGKTVISTLFCKAARRFWPREQTAFLKPVSTGALNDADDRCERPLTSSNTSSLLTAACISLAVQMAHSCTYLTIRRVPADHAD